MSNSKLVEIYTYYWNCYEENGSTGIRIFGINDNFESVFVLIPDFLPYAYLELPETISSGDRTLNTIWNNTTLTAISSRLDALAYDCKPIKREFRRSKKLYFAKLNQQSSSSYSEFVEKTYPFLKCSFGTKTDIQKFSYKIKKPIYVPQLGNINIKIHEMESNPILQFQCAQNIKPSSWAQFRGEKILDDNKESLCDHEYVVNYKNFLPLEKNTIATPYITSFDIEVNSKNPNKAPSAGNPEDKIFQISCVSCRNGDTEDKYVKCLLTLCKNKNGDIVEPDQKKLGEDIEIRMFETEGDLLNGFTDYIIEMKSQIICGYNIFRFDLPYMLERSKVTYTTNGFTQLSYLEGVHCQEKEIKWSSSAFKNQEFKYIDAPGRMWVDMYPVIQRDYKLENYKLKTVSDHFLGQTKDPLTVQGIFKCYRMFTPDSLAICGKYCVQDSFLVLKLFEKLQVWISLSEMSNICNVPMFTLFTQGQQIKIYSQVYKKCLAENIVIDKASSESLVSYMKSEKFTGAYVFEPVPGIYDMVTSFDFNSLYPSIIIAYNICYSTLVLDESIPDEKCHVFDWYDHIGCGCPEDMTRSKKTKVKSENIVCEKRYFRFLKEPIGVLPSLLKYLGDARNNAKADMKKLVKLLPTLTGKEKEDVERMIVVYDKKQLAYKVSSNSIYGSMGVKKGYLPFLPGAMCTTFKGRISIEKAAEFVKTNYSIKLIYGDSVPGYTPVLVNDNGVLSYKTIDEITDGNWVIRSDGKEISNVKQGIKIWSDLGFTEIIQVIRHAINKPIIRVLTHTGCVDSTSDHSLLRENGEKVKPTELNVGEKLLHMSLPVPDDTPEKPLYASISTRDIENYEIQDVSFQGLHAELAFVWGMFFAEGSCGRYQCKSGKKASWAISGQDNKLLERCVDILEKHESPLKFKILDTMKSSNANKLVPYSDVKYKRNVISSLVDKYRELFYDMRSYKRVPDIIINAPFDIRQSFFMGYYAGDGCKTREQCISFANKGHIGSAGLYYIAKSLGYKMSLNIHKRDIYAMTSCANFRKNPKEIKKIYGVEIISDKIPIAVEYVPKEPRSRSEHKNDVNMKIKNGIVNYKGIKFYCEKPPRQKTLDKIEKAIPVILEKKEARIVAYIGYTSKINEETINELGLNGRRSGVIIECVHCNAQRITGVASMFRKDKEEHFCGQIYEKEEVEEKKEEDMSVEYVYDIETGNHHFGAGVGEIIVKNTDSLYIKIPGYDTVEKVREMDAFCREIEQEVSAQFPPPMKFLYEEHIYTRYMILSKKRYVALTCDLEGNIEEKMTIRGILLNRRDNSKYVRDLYSKVIMKSFYKESADDIIYMINQELNNLCANNVSSKDLAISKSIGNVADYKIKVLNEDDKKCIKRLKDLELYDEELDLNKVRSILNKFIAKEDLQEEYSLEYEIVKEYIAKCLPGQVQLAERMRSRGQRIDAGERLGYVVIEGKEGVKKQKISQKLEDLTYFKDNCSVFKIDVLYYINLMINPMDEVFTASMGIKDVFKKIYKYRENYSNVVKEIKDIFTPKIQFVEDVIQIELIED